MLNVYQIVTKPTNARNWDEMPEDTLAWRDLNCFGSEKFETDKHWKHYSNVAIVETDNLETAFHLMNVWNDESRVTRLSKLHSMSVGDIVEQDGTYWMVDGVGFSEVKVA